MTWQTMDTAPKDGTPIIVWDDGIVPWVRWNEDVGDWMSDFIRWIVRPTHWMPFPKAPE
jgi:hypothetical protein